MLPRSLRLTSKRDVQRVYQKGTRQSGQFLLVRLLPNREQQSRVVVVVSTSVSKKATERNRAKRVLRALLSRATLPPVDLVVSVRRLPAREDWYSSFKKDLSRWFLIK